MGAREDGPLGDLVAAVRILQKAGATEVTATYTDPASPTTTLTATFGPAAVLVVADPEPGPDPEKARDAKDAELAALVEWSS